jgi:predicted aconitase with swiveling domain
MASGAIRASSVLVAGTASGEVLVLARPLSLWGGVDPERGVVTSHGHPQLGSPLTGRVVVMPVVIGSSSSSSVLAEMLRRGTGPCALVLGHPDSILAVGSIVAGRMYGTSCPIVVLDAAGMALLSDARWADIRDGLIDLGEAARPEDGLSHTAAPGAMSP